MDSHLRPFLKFFIRSLWSARVSKIENKLAFSQSGIIDSNKQQSPEVRASLSLGASWGLGALGYQEAECPCRGDAGHPYPAGSLWSTLIGQAVSRVASSQPISVAGRMKTLIGSALSLADPREAELEYGRRGVGGRVAVGLVWATVNRQGSDL